LRQAELEAAQRVRAEHFGAEEIVGWRHRRQGRAVEKWCGGGVGVARRPSS